MPIEFTTDPKTGAQVVNANVPKQFPKPESGYKPIAFSTSRALLKGARDLTQELLGNLPADELSKLRVAGGVPRKPGDPDAPILGILPALPKVEANPAESFLSSLIQGGLGFALTRRGLRAGAGAAMRAPGAQAAAQAVAPVRAAVSTAATRATQAPGLKGFAGRVGVTTIKEAPASFITGYAAFKPEPQRLSDHALRWVEQQRGTPLYGPLVDLVRSEPGDTASQARWKNGVEGLFLDPAANAVVETLGLAARATVNLWKARQAAKPAAEQVVDTTAKAAPAEPIAQPPAAEPGKPKGKPRAVEVTEAYEAQRRTPMWEKKGVEIQERLPVEESVAKAEAEYQKAIDDVEVATARAANTVPDVAGAVPPEARGTELPSYSQVRETPVAEIATDPQRFQFKEAGRLSKTGVSGSLKEAAEYDPLFGKIISTWRDPANGQLYVVNGHNRLALAQRSGRQSILTWEIEAPTAEQARAIGAMENMAEGMGTPWDAAKIMRDMGMGAEQLRQRNINVRGPVAEKAIPLSRLPQEIFDKGVTGKLDIAKAVALGSEPLDEAIIRDVAAAAGKGKWSAEKILQAMQEAKFAQTSTPVGDTLPGMEDMFKTSNFNQLLDVRTESFKALREEMVALTSAARPGRKGILEAAGDVIDVAGSQAAREQAAAAVEVFNRVTGYTGPVRDLLNEMAAQVKGRRTAAVVVNENIDRLRQAIEDEVNGPRLPLEEPAAAAGVTQDPQAREMEALGRFGGLGEAIGASLRDGLWDAYQKGSIKFAGIDDPALAAARRAQVPTDDRAAFNAFLDQYGRGEAPAAGTPPPPRAQALPAESAELKALLDKAMANLPAERRAEVLQKMQEAGVNPRDVQERMRASVAGKAGMPDFGSVGEGARLIRRLRDLSNQAKAAEGAEVARLTNEMSEAIREFTTPLWKRPTTVQAELLDGLRAELQRIAGPEIKVQFERQIELSPEVIAKMRQDWGIPDSVPDSEIKVAGLYDPTLNLIRIALADKTPHQLRGSGYHEAVHYLNDKIFTPQENAVLRNARPELEKIAARGGGDMTDADDFEIIAEAAAVYNLSRQAGIPIKVTSGLKGLFDKFLKFLDATKNWAQRNGFQTWEDVFERAYQGQVAGRTPGKSVFAQEAEVAGRGRVMPEEPEGPVPVDPPAGPENSDDWVRRFARQLEASREALLNGEITMEDLMANSFQKVQSPSGKTVYTAKREDLVDGLNAMSKVLPDRPTESGIPVFSPEEVRRFNQDWFTRHGEDGESIMAGLKSLTRGFDEYQQGALNRAMAYADKKQVEAAQEAALWLNSANFDGLNESERLARLVAAAEASRATHQAIMRVTRPWGQLGLEMQIPRDYDIPANQNVKDAEVPEPPVVTDVPAGQEIDVDTQIKQELEAEQAKPIEETLTNKIDPDLTEAINGGEITPKAQAAADALAQSLVSIGADAQARTKFWRAFDDTRSVGPNPLLMLRTNNLISGGATTMTNLFNGMLNLARLPIQQAAGGAIKGEMKRAMYSLLMYQQYWMNMTNAIRTAGHAFKAGQSLFNLESSTVDYLARIAKQEAQGELLEGPEAMTGWTVNTMNMGEEYAKTLPGQMANHLWRVLGTGATRIALTIDTFNSTLAGYAYEHVRHLPRGMELAVERGMKDMSPEAWKWAQQYAAARTEETIKDAVINGKNLADIHMESPQAQRFMDSVNFTDKIWADLEPRTYAEGVRLGQARGLEKQELQDFAKQYVEEGTVINKMAAWATQGPVGRLASIPGEAMDALANARYVGPAFRFIQPFLRVPNNIIKAAARNTPAAAFVDTFWRDISSEDPFTRDRALGEVATGSAVLAMATMASAMGYIRFNGGGPIDPAARQKWTDIEGRMPYSVQYWNEEEGKWVAPISMRAFEPFTTLFGAIGDYADIANSLSTEERNRLGGSLVLTLARMSTSGVLSKSYFQGFNELYEAAFNPSKIITGPNQRNAFSRYLSRLAASMVPYSSALRAARREVDPVARTVDPSDIGGLMGFFQETLDEVRNAVPGWSNDMPARRDYITGSPILTTGILGAEQIPAEMPWLQSLMQFTPMAAVQVGRQPLTPVHEEMARLHGKGTNFSGPRAADFGAEMRLSPSELEDYVMTFATVKDEFGRTFQQSATELINSPQYQSWPIEGPSSRFVSLRAAAIQAEIQRFKELAKAVYKATTPKGQLILQEEAVMQADKGEKEYMRRYGGATAQPEQAQPQAWSITPGKR